MFIYSLFMKIVAILCTSVLFVPTAMPEKYTAVSPDELRLNVVMTSDWNMESNNRKLFRTYGKSLCGIFASEKEVDALVFAGDCTMSGKDAEWFDFYGMLSRFNKAENVLVAFGNKDFGNNSDHGDYETKSAAAVKKYNTFLREDIKKVYYSKDVYGYKFIVLSSEDNLDGSIAYISDGQIEWLTSELAKASAEGTPAFVVEHNMIYGKNGEASEKLGNVTSNDFKLREALESCGTDVIYISGHAQRGLTKDSVTTEGRVTYINLPSAGSQNKGDGAICDQALGCVAEVYDGSIVLRFRNFETNQWVVGYDDIVIPIG